LNTRKLLIDPIFLALMILPTAHGQDGPPAMQPGGGDDIVIKCNDPNWNGEGTCIDPSVPKCEGNTDEVCYTNNGDIKNLENLPYCDQVEMSPEGCFDRKDYSDDTGLYPCRDGSDVKDWRDCPDGPEANSNGRKRPRELQTDVNQKMTIVIMTRIVKRHQWIA
jgi:hypothetical protein